MSWRHYRVLIKTTARSVPGNKKQIQTNKQLSLPRYEIKMAPETSRFRFTNGFINQAFYLYV